MRINKTIKVAVLLMASLVIGSEAYALGQAGVTVSNTVNVTYDTGSTVGIAATPAVETFEIDRVIAFTVTEADLDYVDVAPASVGAIQFTLVNTGNDTHDFLLNAYNGNDPFGGTDNFNAADNTGGASPYVIYQEDNTTAGFQAGEDTIITSVNDLCGDYDDTGTGGTCDGTNNSTILYVTTTMPAAGTGAGQVSDGDISAVILAAQAATTAGVAITGDDNGNGTGASIADDPDAVENVFADNLTVTLAATGLTGTGIQAGVDLFDGAAIDVQQNGYVVDTGAFQIQAADVTVSKTVAVISDPINGTTNPKAIPGAILEYSIVVDNDGSAAADNIIITDVIDAAMVLDADFYGATQAVEVTVSGAAAAITNADDTDILTIVGTTITVGNTAASGEDTLDLGADNSIADGGAVLGDDAENTGADADEALITFRVELQ